MRRMWPGLDCYKEGIGRTYQGGVGTNRKDVMTTPPAAAPPSKGMAIFGVIVIVAVIGGCSAMAVNTDTSSSSSSSAGGDTSTQASCSHFRDIASDMSKGILTDTEIRSKMQEVYDTASISLDPGIPDGAQALLAAATAGDPTALATAISAFSTSCSNVGD
jgi:hypothetical protein